MNKEQKVQKENSKRRRKLNTKMEEIKQKMGVTEVTEQEIKGT
jgi:hypothetical protein